MFSGLVPVVRVGCSAVIIPKKKTQSYIQPAFSQIISDLVAVDRIVDNKSGDEGRVQNRKSQEQVLESTALRLGESVHLALGGPGDHGVELVADGKHADEGEQDGQDHDARKDPLLAVVLGVVGLLTAVEDVAPGKVDEFDARAVAAASVVGSSAKGAGRTPVESGLILLEAVEGLDVVTAPSSVGAESAVSPGASKDSRRRDEHLRDALTRCMRVSIQFQIGE